jgi:hypothetical protein
LKVEVVDYQPSHVDEIMTKHPRKRELRFARMAEWGNWKEIWRVPGAAFTLMIDGEPIGSAGIVPVCDGMGEAWAILSNVFDRYRKLVYLATKRGLEKIINDFGLKDVYALIEPNFDEAQHFAYHLGFTRKEAGQFGPHGEVMLKFWRKCR